MTLEEAIIHCKEKACDDTQCAHEHRQLAEWLEELKQRRAQEQQEVDLEKEINRYCGTRDIRPVPDFIDAVARHFYELGKARKK